MVSKIGLQAGAVGFALLLVISLVGGVMAYEQVPEGHVGVEKDWGAVNGDTLKSGANWIIPVQQGVQNVETRARTYTMSATQGEGEKARGDAIDVKTKNGNSVKVDITVRYRIKGESADRFVSDWNNEEQMERRLIRPTIRTVLRDEASGLATTGDGAIYTQDGRIALEDTARSALEKDFEGEPIVLEAVQIRNIELPNSIDQTLNQKEQAKQQVQVEKQKVQQAEQEKQRRIVEAEAEAEEVRIAAEADANATRIRGEALDEHPIVLEQQYIDALKNGETIYVGEESVALTRETDRDDDNDNSTDGGN